MDKKAKAITALRRLKSVNKKICSKFAAIDDHLIEELLSDNYEPHLHEQIKKYGDGQRLFSYPPSINSLESIDAVVLFAMTTPALGTCSNFDRRTPLHKIPHWQVAKPIRPTFESFRLQFMVWQQKVGIHGVNDDHALNNYKWLISRNCRLSLLYNDERWAGINFIFALKLWLEESDKTMILITNSLRKNFDEPILSLIHDPFVRRIKTGLRSKNTKIMEKIGDVLKVND